MPAMVRKKGKARKIVYDVIGKPDNIRFSKSIFSDKVARRLKNEDGRLSK